MEQLYTVKEVADLFRVKVKTIYQWKFYGLIEFTKINGKLLFKQSDIEKMYMKGGNNGC